MLSNAYFLAKFRFDTAENEPAKNLLIFLILLTLTPIPYPRTRDSDPNQRPRSRSGRSPRSSSAPRSPAGSPRRRSRWSRFPGLPRREFLSDIDGNQTKSVGFTLPPLGPSSFFKHFYEVQEIPKRKEAVFVQY